MDSVIVVAPDGYDVSIQLRLRQRWALAPSAEGTWVIEDGTSRVYVTRDNAVRDDLELEDQQAILDAVADPTFYTVDFSDIALCRQVLLCIADDSRLVVDNDHGVRLSGSDFARVLRSQPDWDWRLDRA